MTQPTPLDDTIQDQQPDHAGLHSEERSRINVIAAKAWSAAATAVQALTRAEQSYIKPVGGIPAADIAPGALPATLAGSRENPHTNMNTTPNPALEINYYIGTSRAAFEAGAARLNKDHFIFVGSS